MKKKILLGLLVLTFTSCSKDDDIKDLPPDSYILEAIIGSWAYDTVSINGTLFTYDHTDGCDKDLFQFYNQEGKEFDFEERVVSNCDICAECALTQTILEWDLQNNVIDLYFGNQLVSQLEIIEVNETFLRYKRVFDIDEDGVNDELVISAVHYDPYDEFD